MNRQLIDYYKSQQTDLNFKLGYKEVTNTSFSKFIVDDAESIDDIRECDLLHFCAVYYGYTINRT